MPQEHYARYLNGIQILPERSARSAKSGKLYTLEKTKDLPAVPGFYTISNSKVKVLKLGKSSGGGGVKARIRSALNYWGGSGNIHLLIQFQTNERLRSHKPSDDYIVQSPKVWAAKFEKDVMKEMGHPTKEFYELNDTNLTNIMNAVNAVRGKNNKDSEDRKKVYIERARTRSTTQGRT